MTKFTTLKPASGVAPTKRFSELRLFRGSIAKSSYPGEAYWHYKIEDVPNINKYHECNWDGVILIRGRHPNASKEWSEDSIRRNSSNFPDKGCAWIMVDVDGYDAQNSEQGVREYIKKELPTEFHSAACSIQFSASTGVHEKGELTKRGMNCHLTFFLDREVTNAEIKVWLKGRNVDMALYTSVQPHYVMDPIIGEGVDVRLNTRRIFIDGEPEVKVPNIEPQKLYVRHSLRRRNSRKSLLRELMTCDFIRHFIEVGVEAGAGRYTATRAFCHNVVLADRGDEIVDRALGGHKHENAVKRSLQHFDHPICCSTFLPEIEFTCPNFDGEKCKFGVTAPIAIAGRVK
jgi:hypothetical protein